MRTPGGADEHRRVNSARGWTTDQLAPQPRSVQHYQNVMIEKRGRDVRAIEKLPSTSWPCSVRSVVDDRGGSFGVRAMRATVVVPAHLARRHLILRWQKLLFPPGYARRPRAACHHANGLSHPCTLQVHHAGGILQVNREAESRGRTYCRYRQIPSVLRPASS